MILYFKSDYVAPSYSPTYDPQELDTFQIWYGRSNHWMDDLSSTLLELKWCSTNGISGYCINLLGWNGNLLDNSIESIKTNYETLLSNCKSLGLWLVVTFSDGNYSTYNLDNKSNTPLVFAVDENSGICSGTGASLTAVLEKDLNGLSTGAISSININNGGTGYSQDFPPTIKISSSPGGIDAIATATVDDSGAISAINVIRPGTKYTDGYKDYVPRIKQLIDMVFSSSEGLNNLLMIPVSNYNTNDADQNDIVSYLISKGGTTGKLLYNGGDGVPNIYETPSTFKMRLYHQSNINDATDYIMNQAVSSTPVSANTVYSDLLNGTLVFDQELALDRPYIKLSNIDENSVSTRDYYPVYYSNGVRVYKETSAENYIAEYNDKFMLAMKVGNEYILYPTQYDDNSNINEYKIISGTSATTSNYRVVDSSIDGFKLFEFVSEQTEGSYCRSNQLISFTITKTRDTLGVINTNLIYDDITNYTDTSKLSEWIMLMKSNDVKVLYYDAFYRITNEKNIFTFLNPSNY